MTASPDSPRLRFRRASRGDLPLLVRHWNEPLVRRHLWDDAEVGTDTVAGVVAASDADFARARYGLWILERRDGSFAGVCGMRRVPATEHVELLYSLEPELWGRGLATEAAAGCLRFAFERLALPLVLGGVDEANAASRRVLEKLGMEPLDAPLAGAAAAVAYLGIDAARFRRSTARS